jgi:hypothetical protein
MKKQTKAVLDSVFAAKFKFLPALSDCILLARANGRKNNFKGIYIGTQHNLVLLMLLELRLFLRVA